MKKALLSLVAVAAGYAFADEYDDYIWLNTSESSESAWTLPAHWGDGTGNHPSADYNYYVPAGKTLYVAGRSSGTANAWAGGQLAVAGVFREYVNSSKYTKPAVADLVFLPGSYLRTSALFGGFSGTTKITVKATSENPLVVDSSYNTKSGVTFKFDAATVSGAANTGMLFSFPNSPYSVTAQFYAGSFNDFLGSLMLRTDKTFVQVLPNKNMGTYVFGGDLEVSDGAKIDLITGDKYWSYYSVLSANSIAVTNNGIAQVRMLSKTIHPVFKVAESLTFTNATYQVVSTETYEYTNLEWAATSGGVPFESKNEFKLATLAAEASGDLLFDVNNVVFPADATGLLPFNRKLSVVENSDGSKDLYFKFGNIVPTRLATDKAQSKRSTTPFNNTKFWSTWTIPASDFAGNLLIRHEIHNTASVNFPQATMVLAPGGSWQLYGGSEMEFADIAWMPGAGDIYTWSTSNFRFHGGTMSLVGAGERIMGARNKNVLTIESKLRGDGTLILQNQTLNSDYGVISLAGDNSAFTGRLVFQSLNDDETHYEVGDVRTYLGAAAQWGGAHDGDGVDWNAVSFINSPLVTVTNDVTFTESTRGFYVDGAVRFNVNAGCKLKLANPVTYDGTFKKLGAGVLEIAGTAQFLDDGSITETPTAGKNELLVSAGGLVASSQTAADGLAVTFADDGYLLVAAGAAQGFYDVKCDTPLLSARADGKIPVKFTGLPTTGEDVEVTLCTVNATAASNLSTDAFSAVHPGEGYSVTAIEKRTVGDNVAYVATLKRSGLSLIFK